MTTINQLLSVCHLQKESLLVQTQAHLQAWQSWLQPLETEQGVGIDPTYDDDFLRIKEEVNQLSGVNTGLVCQLAQQLLTQVSKDLQVVTFYTWARLHQDGEQGFAEGLELLAAMVHQFGDKLHPQRSRTRKSALEWIASVRVIDSLSLFPEVDLEYTQRIAGALLCLEEELTKLAPDDPPSFSELYQALELRIAQCGGVDAVIPQNTATQAEPTTSLDIASEITPVTSGRDLLDQAKCIAKYLTDQPQGWLSARHLMTSVRWDTLTQLPQLDAQGLSRLAPPKPENRAHLKRLYLQQNWSELLEHTDALFNQGVNHLWLDVQWYAWQARQRIDSNMVLSDIICQDLQGLLTRLPGLEHLSFQDGTPFADEVTLAWIDKEVHDDEMQLWQSESTHAEPTESDILALEPGVLAKADEEGIEPALAWLQERILNSSERDRWLARLLMARVTEQYGKNEISLHLLDELDASAEQMTLTQWSPDLLFEVKARRLKLLRMKSQHSDADKTRWEPIIDHVLSSLISLDPARAAVLCS